MLSAIGGGGSLATTSSSKDGGAGGAAQPLLVVPAVIDLPYTVAGKGGSSVEVEIANDGAAPLTGLVFAISGAPSISVVSAPATLAAGAKADLHLSYAGSSVETIVQASLEIASSEGSAEVPVFAATGDAGLGDATWEDVIGAGGVICGVGATVAMPAAPYPDGSSVDTDPSVRVFLPERYRDRGAQDLVVHFHGWNTTLDETLSSHLYQEHVYASGANAVLVVPQGPWDAPSGDFGKLMAPGGLARLLREVLVVLYRDGKVTHPLLGQTVLTSHSGGYQAVALNLQTASLAPPVTLVNLYDSLYGYLSTFQAFALAGGLLRSNYTQNGGTLQHNQDAVDALAAQGLAVAETATQRTLRDAPVVIDYAASSHNGSTRHVGAYGERLRWKLPHARRGPRIELREATAAGGVATVRWLAPVDEDVTGFVVERSAGGGSWVTAAQVGASAHEASFALPAGARVRVRAQVNGVPDADVLRSDTFRVDPQPGLLVVDGFDRVLDGSFGGLQHDFAAVVGEAAGPVATVSRRAITEDAFDVSAFPMLLWLLGDQSGGDISLSVAEQQVLEGYVDAGGRLLMSGSELAWDAGQTQAGAAFLEQCFHAKYIADNSQSHTVVGKGPLASLESFTFGGLGAPYPAPWPDVLGATPGGQVLLAYQTGKAAAVGVGNRAALVGFQLELIDSSAALASVVTALLGFLGG